MKCGVPGLYLRTSEGALPLSPRQVIGLDKSDQAGAGRGTIPRSSIGRASGC
jgi:hypothetical protein